MAEAPPAKKAKLDQLRVDPIARLTGTVTLPGSKSLSNRALLLAALSKGSTTVENLLESDDTARMLDALRKIGIKIDESARFTNNRIVIEGNGGPFDVSCQKDGCELFLGNAGTAMRPLAAVVCACKGKFVLDGTARMRERPIQDLVDALQQLGSPVHCTQNPPHGGCPPVKVESDGLSGGSCTLSGKISSQFLSALLMAAPLAKSGTVTIEIKDELVSKPYVDMTVGLMRKFGVEVTEQELSEDKMKPRPRYIVASGQNYVSPGTYYVEGDASGASYFLAGGAITGGPVTVMGCGSESVQGDIKFANLVEKMGATVEWKPNSVTVSRRTDGTQPLKGIDEDCGEIPDAAMTFAAMALFVEDGKPTAIRNVYNWRVKETERMQAICTELGKLGASVEEGRDYCVIQPLAKILPGVHIDTYDDHRMAMVFSLVACGGVPVVIKDPGCTAKTFPTFFTELNSLVAGKSSRQPVAAEEVIKRVTACKVVPVIKLEDAAHAVPLVKALKEGGIDVAEITYRSACAADAIREAAAVEGVCVGAGTVLLPEQVDEAVDNGADFVVSPGFDSAVARRCQARNVLYLPGVITPTEIMMVTSQFKLKVLKFFPASNFGGASTLKGYGAVFQGVSFMPTGGVTEANIGDFVSLPNVVAAGGSWMVAEAAIKKAAAAGDWSDIVKGARKASDAAKAGAAKK